MTILYLEALAAIAVSLSILMAGAWVVQQRTGNSGWVDTVWTFSLGLVGAGSALWPVAGAVPNARQWLVAALVAIWSLRLGTHIAIRTAGMTDDPRYAAFAREWGADSPRKMLLFLQNQGFGSIPVVFAHLVAARSRPRTAPRLASGSAESDASFADEMAARPIAEYTDAANTQRYEVPAAFFAHVLGPNRKYSSCFYKEPKSTLQEAEEEALRQTVAHADLADGQSILELGCGWGSLSLWMARQFPKSEISAVSNSQSQREYIEREAAARGLKNLRVVTADMNVFDPERQFDRIVSIEMFEHILNWRELMMRVGSWLAPDGRFFMHIFTHRSGAYLFDRTDGEDWIGQHFFTGGVMASPHLIRQYHGLFEVEKEWRWSGTHYQRTALDWLGNFDRNRDAIEGILRNVYGNDTALWMRRWRWFLLATAGLFGYAGGSEWGVSHYRMRAV